MTRACPRTSVLPAALLLAVAACSSQDVPGASAPDASAPRAWQRLATPSSALPAVRGQRPLRGFIHAHSPYSHDACDGAGLDADGVPVAACVADLRRGLCEAAEDYAMLTDHPAFMAAADFPDLLYIGADDTPVLGGDGAPIANRLRCEDGREVLVMNGFEDELMAIGLERHAPGTPEEREELYNQTDAATSLAIRGAGGVVGLAHTESREPAFLAEADVDTIEIYNLHAAIDPDIRGEFLGLDPLAPVAALLPLLGAEPGSPEPDLAFLLFFEELPIYLERFDALLGSRRVAGTAGTDSHQNALPGLMADGERGDSFRRMMRWFSNVLLVEGELTPASAKAAIAGGRGYVAFEILGTPAGFDLRAEAGGAVTELGGTATAGATVIAEAPQVLDLDPAVEAPLVSMRLVHVTPAGGAVVGEGEHIEVPGAAAGAYRAEVRITPRHLRAYLGEDADQWIVERPWVLSNPIYVE
jgi:hypothetical protein